MDKMIKVLLITSCSGEKKFSPPNSAFAKDLDRLEQRHIKEKELEVYKIKAKDMFISTQNLMLLESLNNISLPDLKIDISYISSGYGFLHADDLVIPYDINFQAMSMYDLDKRAELLRIHEETYFNAKNYDLIFFLLGYEYLRTLKLPLLLSGEQKQIFFVSHSDEKIIPDNKNTFIIFTGNEEGLKLDVVPSELKGYIFKLISQKIKDSKENIFKTIFENPLYIQSLIQEKINENSEKFHQLKLFDF